MNDFKKGSIQIIAVLALTILWITPASAQERNQHNVAEEINKSEILKTYRSGHGVGDSTSQISQGMVNHPLLKSLQKDCRSSITRCSVGYKAVAGKHIDGMGQVFMDALAVQKWTGRHGCAKEPQVCGPKGDQWSFEIEGANSRMNHPTAIRAAKGLALYPMDGASDAIANTIDTAKKQGELWKKEVGVPYESLFYLGAKDKLPIMLKGLTFNERNEDRAQVLPMLTHLPAWTLSPAQVEEVSSFCVELFPSNDENKKAIAACIRYLGVVGTQNSDAKDFIANFASGQGDSWLTLHAMRAVAGLSLKDAKENLQENVPKAYTQRTKRERKGRKTIEKKVDTWNANWNAIPSAVALYSMGDKKMAKPLAYWLGFEERGGSEKMVHGQAFRLLAREINFAHPKAKKKLLKMVIKTWKKAEKLSKNDRGFETDLFTASLGLCQMGDKTVLAFLMKFITGKKGRDNDIRNILKSWGGSTQELLHGGNSNIGIGRFPVGKDGFSPADAQKVVDTIKKRFKFWTDETTKGLAVAVMLDIQARINAVNNKL